MPAALGVTNDGTLHLFSLPVHWESKKVTMRSNWNWHGGREKNGGDFIDACVCRLSCCFILASTDDLCGKENHWAQAGLWVAGPRLTVRRVVLTGKLFMPHFRNFKSRFNLFFNCNQYFFSFQKNINFFN